MKKIYSCIVLLVILNCSYAQHPGTLDKTFGRLGRTKADFDSVYNSPCTILIQSDKKIVVAGYSEYNRSKINLVRYSADGQVDTTYGKRGKVIFDVKERFGLLDIYSAAIQKDDKVIVAGSVTSYSDDDYLIVRFLPNGNVDSSFANNGVFRDGHNAYIYEGFNAVAVQPDGKIVASGYAEDTIPPNVRRMSTVRLLPDGRYDSTFGTNGVVKYYTPYNYYTTNCMQLQTDGKIIVGGKMNYDFSLLMRYTKDGVLDASFGNGGVIITNFNTNNLGTSIAGIAIQPDNKIVAAVKYSSLLFVGPVSAAARFLPNGATDSSFGEAGLAFANGTIDNFPSSIALQQNGKIILGGTLELFKVKKYPYFFVRNFSITRLNANGSIDSTFGTNGYKNSDYKNTWDYGTAIAIQDDGKILQAGTINASIDSNGDFGLVRYIGGEVELKNNTTVTQLTADNKKGITIFPNPTSNHLFLTGLETSKAEISILNLTGTKLKLLQAKNQSVYQINIKDLPAATYFLNIVQDGIITKQKFIKID